MTKISAMLLLLLLGLSACGQSRDQALFSSVSKDNLSAVQRLIDQGANVNSQNDSGTTPLHLATSVSMARLLIHCGANLNSLDHAGKTPMQTAEHRTDLRMVQVLLEQGADPNARPGGTGALFDVPTAELAQTLIDHGAKVDEATAQGLRPLHFAAAKNRVPVARLLLEHGADANARESIGGNTPLHFAMHWTDPAMSKLLLQHGAKVDLQNQDGYAPLHYAAHFAEVADTRTLLQHGANPFLLTRFQDSPLDLAISSGNPLVETMLKQSRLIYPARLGESSLKTAEVDSSRLAHLFSMLAEHRNRQVGLAPAVLCLKSE